MPLNKLAKALVLAMLGVIPLGVAPACATGTTPLSLVQQFDSSGAPLAGCQLYFYVAGTVAAPQNAYADFALTQPLPNPVTCDQSGRVPQHWLADGLIHIRLTDSSGLQVLDATMQVLGPSSGGGGGGSTVDPTTIAQTGDVKIRLDKAPVTGWVRVNGLTIGNATSGATERANADTLALYTYVWTFFSQPSANTNCPVIGGLGANALADFNAGKQITLQDMRSRTIFAYDDMGNSPRGGFPGLSFTFGNATFAGSFGGANSTTLLPAWIPSITSSNAANPISVSGSNSFSASGVNSLTLSGTNTINVSSANTSGGAGSWVVTDSGGGASSNAAGGALRQLTANMVIEPLLSAGSNNISVSGTPTISVAGSVSISSSGNNAVSVTSNNTGGGAFPSVPSMALGTLYWKL